MRLRLPSRPGLKPSNVQTFFRTISSNSKSSSPTASILNLDAPSPSPSRRSPQIEARFHMRTRDELRRKRAADRAAAVAEELRARKESDSFMRMMPRRWQVGEVYAPHDLSPVEMAKWGRSKTQRKDVVDMLGVNPLDMYRNFGMISQYMTTMGQIKHSSETGLRPKNQRKMAKAIRRVIGMGIHPSVHRHPEILKHELITNKGFKTQ